MASCFHFSLCVFVVALASSVTLDDTCLADSLPFTDFFDYSVEDEATGLPKGFTLVDKDLLVAIRNVTRFPEGLGTVNSIKFDSEALLMANRTAEVVSPINRTDFGISIEHFFAIPANQFGIRLSSTGVSSGFFQGEQIGHQSNFPATLHDFVEHSFSNPADVSNFVSDPSYNYIVSDSLRIDNTRSTNDGNVKLSITTDNAFVNVAGSYEFTPNPDRVQRRKAIFNTYDVSVVATGSLGIVAPAVNSENSMAERSTKTISLPDIAASSGNLPGIEITITPSDTIPFELAAEYLGYTHFNWINQVLHDPTSALTPYLTPENGQFLNDAGDGIAEQADTLPFYWNEVGSVGEYHLDTHTANDMLRFANFPAEPSLDDNAMSFATYLVGVFPDGSWEPIEVVTWSSDYSGTVNGSAARTNLATPDLNGTGGVFDIMTGVNINLLPLSARQQLIANGAIGVQIPEPSSAIIALLSLFSILHARYRV